MSNRSALESNIRRACYDEKQTLWKEIYDYRTKIFELQKQIEKLEMERDNLKFYHIDYFMPKADPFKEPTHDTYKGSLGENLKAKSKEEAVEIFMSCDFIKEKEPKVLEVYEVVRIDDSWGLKRKEQGG